MREFFRGWRRKVGCVTLVMALFWPSEWARSPSGNTINLSRTTRLYSSHGRLTLLLMDHGDYIQQWYFLQRGDVVTTGNRWSPGSRGTFAGVDLGVDVYGDTNQQLDKATWYRVPHWSVVLPLTLLSAVLLLWPQGKRPKRSSPQ